MKRDLDQIEQLAAELDDADINELMGVEKSLKEKRL